MFRDGGAGGGRVDGRPAAAVVVVEQEQEQRPDDGPKTTITKPTVASSLPPHHGRVTQQRAARSPLFALLGLGLDHAPKRKGGGGWKEAPYSPPPFRARPRREPADDELGSPDATPAHALRRKCRLFLQTRCLQHGPPKKIPSLLSFFFASGVSHVTCGFSAIKMGSPDEMLRSQSDRTRTRT